MELGSVFYIGLVLIVGYYSGKLANKLHLPRVSGYILAGMLMSPSILHIFPAKFVKSSDIVTDFALAMITYSIGGSLAIQRIRKLGKSIVMITVFEAEMAFIAMIVGFTLILPACVWCGFQQTRLCRDYWRQRLEAPADEMATLG